MPDKKGGVNAPDKLPQRQCRCTMMMLLEILNHGAKQGDTRQGIVLMRSGDKVSVRDVIGRSFWIEASVASCM